jgi:pyruvate formate lyase activating enzyme
MHECVLYEKKEELKVKCNACEHRCLIPQGKTGICGVRKNYSGKLILEVYGLPVSSAVDPVEKKPLFHFLPGTLSYSLGTIGCNFKCGFCQNYDISQMKELIGRKMTPKIIVDNAIKNNCNSVAYTYNEPTIWIEFAVDIAKLAKEKGLKNILVTNGYMTRECIEFFSPYIDAMNIDLKSFTDKFYKKTCKGGLNPVLETIKLAKQKKIWIEITTLLIPGENDSKQEIENIAKFISSVDKNIPWHISRFFPMYQMEHKNPTEIAKLREAEKIGKKFLNYVYVGNIPEETSTICPKCKKEIIKRGFGEVAKRLKKGKCPECGKKIQGIWG